MRKIALFLFLALTLLLAACRGVATPTPTPTTKPTATPTSVAKTASVAIQNFAFVPAQLTVDRGTRVTWTNEDSATHTVKGSGFESGNLGQGQSFSYTFNAAGDYAYTCGYHTTMRGQVTVRWQS